MRPGAWICLGVFVVTLLGSATSTFAHGAASEAGPGALDTLWRSWSFEPVVVSTLILSAWLYARGLLGWWRGGKVGRGIRRWEALAYGFGWLALVVALASPLHPLGQVLFCAHMTQHEVLMLVAAPLLVLG